MADEFVQGPPPKGVKAVGDEFVQGPPPAGVKAVSGASTQGIGIKPGASDDEIIRAFGYDPELIKKSRYYRPGDLASNITDPNGVVATLFGKGQAMDPSVRPYLPLTQPVGGLLHGLVSAAHGGSQLVTRIGRAVGANTDADVAYKDLATKFADWDYKTNWLKGQDQTLAQKGMDMVGTVVGTPAPPVAKATTMTGKAALAALAGAGGALMQPVDVNPDDPSSYAKQKAKQVGIGTALGAAAPVVVEKVLSPALGKAYNWWNGVQAPGAAEVEALGQKFGVPVTAGDATGSPAMKKTEVALENVPFVGMGKFRAGQDQQAHTAVKSTAEGLMKEMVSQGWTNLDQVKRAAAAGGKRSGEAQALLSAIDNAGSDWNRIMQASGNLKLFQGKLASDAAYDAFEKKAAQYGEVPLVNTMQALEDVRRQLASAGLPDEATQALVNKLYTNLNRHAAKPAQGAVAQAVGGGASQAAVPAASAVDTTFAGLRQLRSSLGSRISDYQTGSNSLVGAEGVGVLRQIKAALEADMEGFAKSNGPELATAWRNADRIYKTQVVPFKDRALANAMTSATPDEIFGQFMKANKGDRAQNFYDALEPKGQAAVRYGLVQNALEKATNVARGDEAAVFSPAKFAGYLENLKDATGVAFKGQDKWEIDGLAKLMRHVERAGQYAENPPTGNRVAQLGTGVGLFELGRVSPGSAAGTWGVAKLSKVLLTTPAGKRLLLAASELPEGSKLITDLVNNQLPKLMSRAVTPETLTNAYQFDKQPQQ